MQIYAIGRYCMQCGICIRICPAKAIYIEENGGYHIDPQKCVGCGRCARMCRAHAIFPAGAGES